MCSTIMRSRYMEQPIKTINFTRGDLQFRRPEQEDAPIIQKLKNNRSAAFLLGGAYHQYSLIDVEKWIEFHNNNPEEVLLVIKDLNSDRLIGHVGLYKIDNVAKKTELGILIADDESRGKGYGTLITSTMVEYAFNELHLHKVTVEVLLGNIPSMKMFKRCGFTIDGCLRDDVFKNDQYYDVLCMSIINVND